jgi:prophage antirepressor-like protein|uniref:Antirepressor protein n=1 Tax=Myoviridae sp. ctsK93 TaxID=2825190 RepID=A0A8S5PIR7_9CAUD|nr:MAG TPA: antirepressor protein [Myoviridae sp. ctsK93]
MNSVKVLTKAEVLTKEFILYGTVEEPLFLAKDVAEWIEYDLSSINKLVQNVDDEEKVRSIIPTLGGEQEMWMLTEDGVYEVLMQSRKPKAKLFKKEVKSILKSIRLNGGYIANQEQLTPEQIVANALIVAQNIINNQNRQIEEMSVKMSELEKKSDYLDLILESKETVTVTQIAQDYGMSAKAFNKILMKLGIQHKVNGQWILYAKYLGEGYVHSKTVSITRSNGMKDTVMNTEWKQKGRIFLYNLLKDNGYIPLIEQ